MAHYHKMFCTQLNVMLQKKGFIISFTIMMIISIIAPISYILKALIEKNDISTIISKEFAYIFNFDNMYSDMLIYIIPILSMLPFSLSCYTEKKLNYYPIMISRCGTKPYYFSKAACCLIGGFVVLFIPAVINIIINEIFLPQSYLNNSEITLWQSVIDTYSFNNANIVYNANFSWLKLYLQHPQIYNLILAFLLGVLGSVAALISYAISIYLKKFSYLSCVPMMIILILGVRYVEAFNCGIINKMYVNLSLIDYVVVNSYRGKSYCFFAIVMIILSVASFISINIKAKREQL